MPWKTLKFTGVQIERMVIQPQTCSFESPRAEPHVS